MASVAIASPVPEEAPAVAPEAIANDARKSSWEYYNCESSWLNPRAPNKLNAKCQRINDDGTYTMVWSELDLNKCVINDNGELKWKSKFLLYTSISHILSPLPLVLLGSTSLTFA